MKITTWNVNSVRARKDRLLAYLDSRAPDVLCLQELKCLDEEFPAEEVSARGYQFALHGQKTYNGVAILSKHPVEDVEKGLNDGVEDPQSRVIAATVQGVRVVCLYAPNGQEVDSPAFVYKLAWYGRLLAYLRKRTTSAAQLVLCGDYNVAPEPKDVHDPVAWEGQTLFTPKERAAFQTLLGFGLTDLFRQHHDEPGKYTWWDYRMLGFPKNRGLRIDHLLGTPSVVARCLGSEIDREERKGKLPSDHAPVWVELK